MKIIVCVKPVLSGQAPGIDILRGSGSTGSRYSINPPDLYAIEEARLVRNMLPGTVVEVLLLGPAEAENVLRDSLARGADRAVHLVHDGEIGTVREAAMLVARYIHGAAFDLVLTGIMAEDTGEGIMGPMLAGLLGIPFVWGAMELDCHAGDGRIRVACELEGGDRLHGELEPPALISVGTGINRPPYPPLSARLRSMEAVIDRVDCAGMCPAPCERLRPAEPLPHDRHGILLQGTTAEKAAELAGILRHRGLV